MRKNLATLAMATLVGIAALLQSGCSEKVPLGSAEDAKTEISNIRSTLRKVGKTDGAKAQIELLRSIHTTAGELKTRWPEAVEVDAFLEQDKEQLGRIPETVYDLSVQTADMESFKWALNHSAEIKTQPADLLKFWSLGPEWRNMVLTNFPGKALPVYVDQAIETHNVTFFNEYAEAFKNRATELSPVETTKFNVKYCSFLATEFEAAVKSQNAERINFLLDYTPSQRAAAVIDGDTELALRRLGDYIFQELKDEALACKLVELRYPLNRIDLEKAGFEAEFMELLNADKAYAVQLLQLDKWHGPLTKQDTLFLLALPPETMKLADPLYIDETVELALKKSKTALAVRLLTFRQKTHPMTTEEYHKLLGWTIQYGNTKIFDAVLKQLDMTPYDLDVTLLAANYKMFIKYAPTILTRMARNADEDGDDPVQGVITNVLSSQNHAAGAWLIQKYSLDKSWKEAVDGRTLLMEVCLVGNLPAAKYLIETKRVAIDARTSYSGMENGLFGRSDPVEGRLSAMHFAAKSGNSELIKYLASKKANVNDRTYYGVTPLMYAVSNGHLEATKMLIALKANVNAKMDARFETMWMPEPGSYEQLANAYRRATKYEHTEILEVLGNAGARL